MNFFTKLGDLIIRMVSFIGMLILALPKIPQLIRNVDTSDVKTRVNTDEIKDNITRIKTNIDNNFKETSSKEKLTLKRVEYSDTKPKNTDENSINKYTSEEKENTVLYLQIASAAFLVFSIIEIFNFIPLTIFIILGVLTIAFILYELYTKVKQMYPDDFNAYRDFFLMYISVGIILLIISGNSTLTMAFSFQYLPSISILLYAVIAVIAVFLIFRIRYARKYTYGIVMESGENTAHVKLEYDIRSNVKPDIYLVENTAGAVEGDIVKVKVEEKLLNTQGNKPTEIIEILPKININISPIS